MQCSNFQIENGSSFSREKSLVQQNKNNRKLIIKPYCYCALIHCHSFPNQLVNCAEFRTQAIITTIYTEHSTISHLLPIFYEHHHFSSHLKIQLGLIVEIF